jgi:hypothetical protein
MEKTSRADSSSPPPAANQRQTFRVLGVAAAGLDEDEIRLRGQRGRAPHLRGDVRQQRAVLREVRRATFDRRVRG